MSDENAMVQVENEQAAVIVPQGMTALQARIERLATDTQLDAMFMKKAEIMAKSNMLPVMFRGDVYGCYALQQLAFVWQTNPVLLAPGLYKVKPDSPLTLDGKTVKSIVGRFAPVKDHYIADEYFGDWSKVIGKFKMVESKKATDEFGRPKLYRIPAWTPEDEEGLGIKLTAVLLPSGTPITYTLLLKQCQTRNSTLWGEDPQLQIWYRAIARFSRKYFPEILNGMYIREEFDDENVIEVRAEAVDGDGNGGSAVKKLKSKIVTKEAEKKKADEAKPVNANTQTNTDGHGQTQTGAEGERAGREVGNAKTQTGADGKAAGKEQVADLKKFLSGYLDSSHAPVTLAQIEEYLAKEKKIKAKMNTAEFPENWTQWILQHPDVLVKYVFEYFENNADKGAAKDGNLI